MSKSIPWQRVHNLPERPEWVELRATIAENVLEHGWHAEAGAYTVAYGYPEMDASSLWIGLSGLLPDDDPRFLATVLAIEVGLRWEYRMRRRHTYPHELGCELAPIYQFPAA